MTNQDPRNPDLFEELLRESARVAADFDAEDNAAAFVDPTVETVALKRTASGTTEIVPTPVTVMKRLSAVPAPFAGIASATTPATAATVTAVRTVRSFVSFMG